MSSSLALGSAPAASRPSDGGEHRRRRSPRRVARRCAWRTRGVRYDGHLERERTRAPATGPVNRPRGWTRASYPGGDAQTLPRSVFGRRLPRTYLGRPCPRSPAGSSPTSAPSSSSGSSLTIAGIAGRRPRLARARARVLGPRQGGLGDERRDRRALRRHRRRQLPAAAGGDAARRARRSARRGCGPTWRRLDDAAEEGAARTRASPRTRRPATTPSSPRTGAPPSRSSTPRRTRTRRSARTRAAEKAAQRALRGATVGGEPVHLTGFDALARGQRRRQRGPRRAAGGGARRAGRAAGAQPSSSPRSWPSSRS